VSQQVRHVLGISGGKDSAALAIYLHQRHPNLNIEYYFCDTGKELTETYALIERLEVFLGKSVTRLEAAAGSHHDPFDHFLNIYGGYLPSSSARWCTKKLKLEPFESFVGTDPVISYVGIRGDEDREGYISKRPNIQSVFPFRRNIWSEDVILKVLSNQSIDSLKNSYEESGLIVPDVIARPVSAQFPMQAKVSKALDAGVREFNRAVFNFLRKSNYPIALLTEFPLIENDDVLVRSDIFSILELSGVGIPQYYQSLPILGQDSGSYARSRSGCYFCFFQQKIEWVWLYEQHPDLFAKAMEYEKLGYSWQEERLEDLIQPERIQQIKSDFVKKSVSAQNSSPLLLDILDDAEAEGCAACFI
jgi:hypothetical protein